MDAQEGEVREGSDAQARAQHAIPTACPFCSAPTQKRTFVNGTIEVRCVKTEPAGGTPAHGFTLYVKPR